MSTLAFAAFLVTLLSVASIGGAATKDPEEYWVAVMEEEPMPEAIRGLVRGLDSRPREDLLPHGHCHSHHGHRATEDCETATSDDHEGKKPSEDEFEEEERKFADSFQPRRGASADGDGAVELTAEVKKKLTNDFDPRPSITDYRGKGRGEKPFTGDFDPRPNISVYQG